MAKAKKEPTVQTWLILGLIVSNLVLIYISAMLWNQTRSDNEQNTANIYKVSAQAAKLEACYNQDIKPCN
jgi:competence protein ComGC